LSTSLDENSGEHAEQVLDQDTAGHDRVRVRGKGAAMYPSMPDYRFTRSRMEERLKRAEYARLANEVRRAGSSRSLRTAIEAEALRDELVPEASERIVLATPALRDQGMPPEEIDAILRANDPEVIRRYLELHRERLEERLADHRRTIGHLVQGLSWRAGDSDCQAHGDVAGVA
jgi:hypothetical protein